MCVSGPDHECSDPRVAIRPIDTCVHAPRLAPTSNQLLCTGTGTPAPLLITGPSFPPVTQGPISMFPSASISLSRAPGMPVELPAWYSAIQSASALPAPYTALERHQRHAERWSTTQHCITSAQKGPWAS